MIYLGLSILSATLIFVAFKCFDRYKVNTMNAIIVNYLTASSLGLALYQGKVDPQALLSAPWAWGTVAMGILFISIFNLMAMTSQRSGVSVASVATKMSLAIPVLMGVVLYGDRLSPWQLLGILLALAAVYLASLKEERIKLKFKDLWLPLLVFLGSGIIDTAIKYFEEMHLQDREIPLFSAMIFGCAALSGLIFVGALSRKSPPKVRGRDLIGGVCLGVPNYFSIYFMIQALRWEAFNSAAIFTLNNVGIVLLSTLVGILVFKERLSPKNWSGVGLAVVGIILVALF